MNTISFTKGNNVIKRGDNVTPLSIKLMPENEIDKANITVRLSNSLGYLMDLEKVYINEDKTLNIILTDKETEQLPSDIYGLEVWVSKDDRDIIYPSDGQAMFRLTNNSLDFKGETIPVITLEQFVDRYDELEKRASEVVSESYENITEITTNAIMEVIETVSNANISLSQIVTTGTAEIDGIKEIAISTIRTEISNMLKLIADNQVVKYTDAKNWQKNAITTASGAPKYDLNATKDIFQEAILWGNGFHTFYLSAGAVNNPAGTTSYVMGFAQFYGNAGGIKAYDKLGRSYYAPRLGVEFGRWSEFVATDTDDIE